MKLHLYLGLSLAILASTPTQAQTWESVEDGILFTEINEAIWIFKIDPAKFKFSISANVKGLTEANGWDYDRPLPKWGRGINLNMFTGQPLPNGYTKVNGEILQAGFNNYNLFLVWNDEEVKFLDRREEDISAIHEYPNVSQNIRMIKATEPKRNRWQVDQKYWSVSTIATTTDGQVLLIHSRKPHTMNTFVNILLANDNLLKIHRMGYAEGGPESSIYINEKYNRMGSFETGFNENDDNKEYWDLPFALTFQRRK